MSQMPVQIRIVRKEVPAMSKGFDLVKKYVVWEILEPWNRETCDDWREILQTIRKNSRY